MRKVILELDPATVELPPALKRIDFQKFLSKIEFIEGTNLFNIDPELSSEASMTVKKAGIFRIKLRKGFELSDLINPMWGATVFEPLQEKDGVITCFIKAQVNGLPSELLKSINFDNILMTLPLHLSKEKFIISFLGDNENIKAYMNLLNSFGISYKVSIQNPDIDQGNLSYLTKRQRKVLTEAQKLGYYDHPRRISSQELADQLGICKSTLIEHLRKAEKRLIDALCTTTD